MGYRAAKKQLCESAQGSTLGSLSAAPVLEDPRMQEIMKSMAGFSESIPASKTTVLGLRKSIRGRSFNRPVQQLRSLTWLDIESDAFNQPVANLPCLKYLMVTSDAFNQPIQIYRI